MPDGYQYEQALAHSQERADEIVRNWSLNLHQLCDDAGVSINPPAVDVGGEMKRLVDELLAKP